VGQGSLIRDALVLYASIAGERPRGGPLTKQADALASLASGGITERAEAVRELGRLGDEQVLDTLLTAALKDKSPAVRLAAASAAADVLARYRLEPHRGDFASSRRRELIEQLRSIDPGRNTGLFQVLACAGDPAVVRNLGRGMRDPRVDVRTGALVGLERLVCSGSVNGDPRMARELDTLLDERRLRSDALLGLARLAWRTGLWQLRGKAEDLGGRLEERWLPQLDELLDGFPEKLGSEHVLGCWLGPGLDCGEQRPDPGAPVFLIVLPSTLVVGGSDSLQLVPWSLEEGRLGCTALGPDEPLPVRVLRTWFDGQDDLEVLQIGSTSYGRLVEKELPAVFDLLTLVDFDTVAMARQLLAMLDPQLSGRAAGNYCRGVLAILADDVATARVRLEALGAAKRPRPEVFWHLAQLDLGAGSRAKALAMAQRYLEAAPRKSPFAASAQALVDQG